MPRGIELRRLRKTYRTSNGPIGAVRGIDIAIEPGETVALLGRNGAGRALVQASHVGVGGHSWNTTGWTVMAAWTVIAARLAMRAYARDTGRG